MPRSSRTRRSLSGCGNLTSSRSMTLLFALSGHDSAEHRGAHSVNDVELPTPARLFHQRSERIYVSLQRHEEAHQRGERDAMEKYVAQDVTLVTEPVGRRGRDHDALRIDHLAHHATRAVGRAHQYRLQPDLFRGHSLQAAEQHIGCGI